uniref:Carbohydrate kinase PfkB domain-containing protein n=1 Tax=Panagrolaimus sp. ES5 TaxID=591445 RepID=A0AC34GQ11_9BILA
MSNDGGSYKGSIFQRCGGVARNHAEALGRLGCESTLLTAVGNDDLADYLRTKSTVFDISHANIARGSSSATYMSVNINGNIVHGFSSIEESIASITPEYISKNESLIAETDYIVIDGNLPENAIKRVIDLAEAHRKKVWFEPTDIAKATKILHSDCHLKIHSISPNANETAIICEALGYQSTPFSHFEEHLSDFMNQEVVSKFLENAGELRMGFDLFAKNQKLSNVFITLGSLGILGIHHDKRSDKVICFPIPPPSAGAKKIVSVSGAGDCFNSGFLAAQLYGHGFEQSVQIGRECAKESLLTVNAVPETLNLIGEKLIEDLVAHVHTADCRH